jgi:hypothetical protein
MIHLLDEPYRQKLHNIFADVPVLLLVEVAQVLLYRLGARLDPQVLLSDFPRNVWHI